MKKNLHYIFFIKFTLLILLAYSHKVGAQINPLSQANASQDLQTLVKPLQAFAQPKNTISEATANPLAELIRTKPEDVSKRTATAKHFRNTDGSYTAVISTESLHYSKNGTFYDIDTKIAATNDAKYKFANTNNLFESHFGNTSSAGVKSKVTEGEVIEFLNGKMFWEVNGKSIGIQKANDVPVNIIAEKAYYKNIFPNINAEFIIQRGKRKLNYIIPNKQALGNIPTNAEYLVFSEDIILPKGWTHEVSESGVLIKNQQGKEIYLYENPVSTDASNKNIQKVNTIFETTMLDSILVIQTKLQISWLLNPNRVFPIKVDPSVNVLADGGRSVFSTNLFNSNLGFFGRDNDGQNAYWLNYHIKFNTSSIPNGSTINSVAGYRYQISSNGTRNASSTWAWGNSADPTTTSGLTLYNSVTALQSPSVATSNTNNSWQSIAFTAGGRTYVSNSINNLGYVALAVYPSGSWNSNQYYGNQTHSDTNKPYLLIDYTSSIPPSCATNISPTNGATGAPHQGFLIWNSATGATSYDVYFGNTPSPSIVSTSQTGTSYAITQCLLPNTTYYWRVIPKNANGSATACATWSFTTDNKLNIYKTDFENASLGYFGTSGLSVDGWYTNNNNGTGAGIMGYNNTWTVGNGINAISGNSAGVSALYNGGLAGSYFQYYSDLGEIHRWIYRPFDMRGLRDIEVGFRWKAGGEASQDFGSVISSINNGTNYLTHNQGGLNNDGRYWNSPTAIQTQSITLPETRNNQQNFILGFRWDDMSGNNIGTDPTFVVDDIVIKACPYEGNIASTSVSQGVYEWTPTGSTQTTLSVNGSHSCAQYQWEQSTDNGTTWTTIPGATTSSYTTPSNLLVDIWYRSRVYFGTGCPGVYQGNPFKVLIFIPKPENIIFHNYGDAEQLAFNNGRLNTNTPIFRLSHQSEKANEYQIEINTNHTFAGGTSWAQSFTGNYPLNTETNFTFNNGFSPSFGTTYYVRARAMGDANTWSSWTTDTYSFTYDTNYTVSNWFQTTQAQFQTDILAGTQADTNHDISVINTDGNVITNGSFETNLIGWTKISNFSSGYNAIRSTSWASNGTASLEMNNNNPGSYGYTQNDYVGMYQTDNLTGVSNLLLDANYRGQSSVIVQLRVYITDVGQENNISAATEVHRWIPPNNNSATNININLVPYNFTGNKVIKIVYYVASAEVTTNMRYINVDNIRTIALPKGTATSTPVTLTSVQNATKYDKIRWNQTLGGGTLKLKVQQTTLGGNTWTDVAGYDNISATGDGEKEFDLSSMTAYPQIRLVATLDGSGAKLHDWAIIFPESCDKTWSGAISNDWSNPANWIPSGIPTDKHCIIIPNVINKPNVLPNIIATGKTLELQANAKLNINTDASIKIANTIVNNGDQDNFVLENNASLTQGDVNTNTFNFTYKRNTSVAWARDYIYLSSPVNNTKINEISNEVGKNFSSYYSWSPVGTTSPQGLWTSVPAMSIMTAGRGYIARIPTNWTANTIYKMNFRGTPNNGNINFSFKGGNATDIPSTTDIDESLTDKWNLIGNPYPSAVDASKFLNNVNNKNLLIDPSNPTAPSNGDGALYFWNHKDGTGAQTNPFYGGNSPYNYSTDSNNHYITKNLTGTVPVTDNTGASAGSWNGMIPAGQSFYIRSRPNIDAVITFDNTMRVDGNNDNYYKINPTSHRFWLDFSRNENNKSAQALIGYLDNATNQLDFLYDGLSMDNELDIYSIVQNHSLLIQGRALPFDQKDVIQLGYKAPASGTYKIGLYKTEGLFAPYGTQSIYLKDNTNNKIHDLIDSPYEFVTSEGRFNNRFEIVYQKATLDVSDNKTNGISIVHDLKNHNWLISAPQSTLEKVEVYELSGKLIYIKKEINSSSIRIPFSEINQKVVLIKVQSQDGKVVTKKVINP